jgi:ribosomal protein S18 acetylase RimI-like enzyme
MLVSHAKQLSPAGLHLVTHQRNQPARRLYEQHGFTEYAWGHSPAPENEPDVWYRWVHENRY